MQRHLARPWQRPGHRTMKPAERKKYKTPKKKTEKCGNVIKWHINVCKQQTRAQDKIRQKLSVGGSGEEEERGGAGGGGGGGGGSRWWWRKAAQMFPDQVWCKQSCRLRVTQTNEDEFARKNGRNPRRLSEPDFRHLAPMQERKSPETASVSFCPPPRAFCAFF